MKQLESISIVSPGFFGLNTQESGSTLSPNFATVAENAIIDQFGRLGTRKGWVMQTTNGNAALNGKPVKFMLEHVNADNTSTFLSAGNLKLLKGGTNSTSFTDVTPGSYTITNNNWAGASLLDHAVLVQKNHEPIVYTESASPVSQTMTTYTGLAQNYGSDYPFGIIAAYGRFWAFTKTTVYWSTDIADSSFPCFCSGTSGSLNITSILPNNVDEITALAVHNDLLIIFCKNNVVIYKGAINPIGVQFGLHDIIAGVGCIAQHTVKSTGNDLVFLSNAGIRSFGRLVQEKSLPLRDLSKNVFNDLTKDIKAELISYGSLEDVNAVYSEKDAFYLLIFPNIQKVYVVDMKAPLQDGAARITTWIDYKSFAMLVTRDRDLLIGKEDGIGLYSSYSDNGSNFPFRYLSHYIDLQSPTTLKILKQVKATVYGGSNQQFNINIATDYSNLFNSYPFIIGGDMVISEWGSAEYNISEYTLGVQTDTIKSSVGGAGNIIQLGFEADVNGNNISVQAIDCFVKTGRNR